MVRLLTGLNAADAQAELHALGFSEPETPWVRRLQSVAALKLSGHEPEHYRSLGVWLSKIPAVTLLTAPLTGMNSACLIMLPNNDLTSILQTLSDALQPPALWPEIRAALENAGKDRWVYSHPGGEWVIERPVIMGILNLTPDSFSDGGRYLDTERAVVQAEAMLAAGADIIDIGGESTRPGAAPVDAAAEWERVAPLLRRLARNGRGLISIDTSKSEVAERALGEGAHIINDVTALRGDARMAKVAAAHRVPLVLMHLQGTPRTMQQKPAYENLLEEVLDHLAERCRFAREQGVSELIVDPGIGFGKRPEDNYELLRRLGELKVLGYPLLLGASRKSFIGNLLGLPVEERLYGSLAAALIGVACGANILRVHDVAETRQMLEIFRGVKTLKAGGETV